MASQYQTLALRVLVGLAIATTLPVALSIPSTTGNIYFYNSYDANTEVGYWKIPKNPPAQRCYSFSCHQDDLSFVKWNRMQENAWLVFFDDVGCTGAYIRAFGPEGTLRPDDRGWDNRIASFMLWESGIYPTRGIVDSCYREPTIVQASSNVTHSPPTETANVTHNFGSNASEVSSEAETGMDFDEAVGSVKPAAILIGQ